MVQEKAFWKEHCFLGGLKKKESFIYSTRICNSSHGLGFISELMGVLQHCMFQGKVEAILFHSSYFILGSIGAAEVTNTEKLCHSSSVKRDIFHLFLAMSPLKGLSSHSLFCFLMYESCDDPTGKMKRWLSRCLW